MLPAVAVILALSAARWSVSPYAVQYDELTIRAICAMRYAAALTVQAANCSWLCHCCALAVQPAAPVLAGQHRAVTYEPAIDRITRPRTAAETTTARVPHK